jgi:hypothetical protein
MLNIIQVLLRPRDIKASGSRPHPTGPDFPEHLIDSADMLVVLSGTSEEDLVTTYEYRLYRMHRLLDVKKISCAHQSERRRVKLPPGDWRRNEAVTQLQIPSALSVPPASAGRLIGVVMAGTPAEDIEYAIRAINKLSALVDRNYGDEPEEADDAQRQGAEAVRRLRLLKSDPGATGASVKSDGREEDALAA